ncbi:hypothetical protein BZG35_14225 [Brevundimonas sp. LM2]|uniref:Ca2+-dependent phosphoinositide-specific phospholipase C n=1 Tax=Brevundimonas sp. LM2 TaxID=1938605 RepID=UPI000983DEEB|nr:Ca2+-dependent phosphoinositide-specific phospholipase C [Brevundimonas sp. LM2]AQR62674.1 hypothetical protein BZG35_14225 [Brevundimonas sp. LM2]
MSFLSKALLAALSLLFAAPASAQDDLRINQIQILGSHNSYRPYPDAAMLAAVRAVAPTEVAGLEYGHPPLDQQLALGVRQFEFDPVSDSAGGLFAAPYADDPEALRIMRAPGAKVLHIPPFDYRTDCLTLALCLQGVADWSDAHPGHPLLVILVNNRDAPEPYTAEGLDAVDVTIRGVFGPDRLITPDRVRGDHASLRDAVLARAWPTVEAARGKVLVVHDTGSRLNALYAEGHPGLRGRAMFGFYPEDADEAAIFNIQDPVAEGATIRRLVAQGFLVRSRADSGTVEARAGDLGRLEAAVQAGAQIISTDYYPGAPDPLGLGFVVRLADGFSQPNPRAAAAGGGDHP